MISLQPLHHRKHLVSSLSNTYVWRHEFVDFCHVLAFVCVNLNMGLCLVPVKQIGLHNSALCAPVCNTAQHTA